ncbi:MAG: YHS domain-containing protein [Planctomycetales bacterium]
MKNARIRQVAKTCLYSTVTGVLLTPASLLMAQSPARIRHADAVEIAESESIPQPELGSPAALPKSSGVQTPGAAHKITGQSRATESAKRKPAPLSRRSGTSTAPKAGANRAADGIRQTAGMMGRNNPPARAESQPAPVEPGASSPSEVERQLQELYRKNGRQMPDMNWQEFQSTQTPPATSPAPRKHEGLFGSGLAGRQTAKQPAKPNLFERMFGFGRSRKKAPPAPQAQNQAPARPQAAPAAPPSRPVPQYPPFRPNAVAPAVPPQVAPAAPAAPAMREPAPLGPAGISPDPLSSRGFRSLLDESAQRGDEESLDLAEDDSPQELTDDSADGLAENPYTGRTIAPNESEESLAQTDSDLFEEELSAPLAPSTASTAGAEKPAATVTLPIARPVDETLDLEDEEDEEDEDDAELKAPEPTPPVTAAKPSSPTSGNDHSSSGTKSPAATVAIPASGFKGYCPVTLKEERKLVEARREFSSEHNGRLYSFSSLECKEAFDANPKKYIPAGEGRDVVKLATGEKGADGSLQHAAWYRGRLYLFSSPETRREFVESPNRFSVSD